MPVDSTHSDFDARLSDWLRMRATDEGESAVKDLGENELPMPSGFREQPDNGRAMYAAYLLRAQFPEIVAPTVQGMVGTIHRTQLQIAGIDKANAETRAGGDPLSYMWEHCTSDGMPLQTFVERVTAEVLRMGRFGILVDMHPEDRRPYLSGWNAETIRNWREDRSLWVLDESHWSVEGDDEFVARVKKQYLVLRFQEGVYTAQRYVGDDLDEEPVETPGEGVELAG